MNTITEDLVSMLEKELFPEEHVCYSGDNEEAKEGAEIASSSDTLKEAAKLEEDMRNIMRFIMRKRSSCDH